MGCITVIHGDDYGTPTRRVTFLQWRVPPNAGDLVETTDGGVYVVDRRVWTKTGDLEIHLRAYEEA
jgi:hypothetical protein